MSRHAIRFERWYSALSSALLLPPSDAWIDVRNGEVECRMSWAFRSRFPRSAVAGTKQLRAAPLSRGVHGFGGRWLVNGAGAPLIRIELATPQRARVLGFPVRLRELIVSVEDPDRLAAELRR